MNGLDVEAVLHAEFHNGFGCEYHESRLHECSKFQRAAHVAAVLRVEINRALADAWESGARVGATDDPDEGWFIRNNPYRPTLSATEGD